MSLADDNDKRLRRALDNILGPRVPPDSMEKFVKILMHARPKDDPAAYDQRLNLYLLSMDPIFSKRLADIPANRTKHAIQVAALQAMSGVVTNMPTMH